MHKFIIVWLYLEKCSTSNWPSRIWATTNGTFFQNEKHFKIANRKEKSNYLNHNIEKYASFSPHLFCIRFFFAGMVFMLSYFSLRNDVQCAFSVQRSAFSAQRMKITKYKMNIGMVAILDMAIRFLRLPLLIFHLLLLPIPPAPVVADKTEDSSLFSQQVIELCLWTLLIDTKWNVCTASRCVLWSTTRSWSPFWGMDEVVLINSFWDEKKSSNNDIIIISIFFFQCKNKADAVVDFELKFLIVFLVRLSAFIFGHFENWNSHIRNMLQIISKWKAYKKCNRNIDELNAEHWTRTSNINHRSELFAHQNHEAHEYNTINQSIHSIISFGKIHIIKSFGNWIVKRLFSIRWISVNRKSFNV